MGLSTFPSDIATEAIFAPAFRAISCRVWDVALRSFAIHICQDVSMPGWQSCRVSLLLPSKEQNIITTLLQLSLQGSKSDTKEPLEGSRPSKPPLHSHAPPRSPFSFFPMHGASSQLPEAWDLFHEIFPTLVRCFQHSASCLKFSKGVPLITVWGISISQEGFINPNSISACVLANQITHPQADHAKFPHGYMILFFKLILVISMDD